MLDILKISSETASHAVEVAAQQATSGGFIEGLMHKMQGIGHTFHVEPETLASQIVSFLLIFIALRYLAWGPVLKILDERRTKIADGLQYAEEMKAKLADAERRQAETLKEAALEARQITADAQKSAKEMIEKSQTDAQHKAEELIAQTRESLTLERRQMMTEVKEHAAHLVALTTAKVLSRELSDAERKRYAEQAVQELSK